MWIDDGDELSVDGDEHGQIRLNRSQQLQNILRWWTLNLAVEESRSEKILIFIKTEHYKFIYSFTKQSDNVVKSVHILEINPPQTFTLISRKAFQKRVIL